MSARRRFGLFVSLLLTLFAFGAAPAHAEDIVIPTVATLDATPPALGVEFTHTATSQTACAWGALREPPATNREWRVVITGARASATQPTISETRAYPNVNGFNVCITVQKFGAVAGGFTAVVSYTGVGSDYPSEVFGISTWEQGEDFQVGTSQ